MRSNIILSHHFTSYNWSWDWSPLVVAPEPPNWCPLLVGAPWWCPWWWCPWWCESVGVVRRSPDPLLPAAIGISALPPPPPPPLPTCEYIIHRYFFIILVQFYWRSIIMVYYILYLHLKVTDLRFNQCRSQVKFEDTCNPPDI